MEKLPVDWVDHVAYQSQDVDKLANFYVKTLGFQVLKRPPFPTPGYWLLFPNSTQALHIIGVKEKLRKDPSPFPHPEALQTGPHIAIRTSNFDEILTRLTDNNVIFHTGVVPMTGCRQIWFFDPEGNGVELGEFPIYQAPVYRFVNPENIREDITSFFQNKTVLVTGCSQGIGLEFINQLTKISSSRVIATHRPSSSTPLLPLSSLLTHPSLHHLIPLDVTDFKTLNGLSDELKQCGVSRIDVLIHNAGIVSAKHPYSDTLEMDLEDAKKSFETNSLGAVAVMSALSGFLGEKEEEKQKEEKKEKEKGKVGEGDGVGEGEGEGEGKKTWVVMVNSQLGSLRDALTGGIQGKKGGSTCYRMSKVANNMVMRCLAAENPDWVVVSQSPGWVDTRMGSSQGRKPPLSPEESVNFMLRNISRLNLSDSGKFLDHTGSILPF